MRQETISYPVKTRLRLQEISQQDFGSDVEVQILWKLRMAETHNYTYQFNDFNLQIESAAKLIQRGLAPRLIAMVKLYQGIRMHRDGDYHSTRVILRESIDYARRANDDFTLIYAMTELAYTQSLEEQYEISLNQLQQAYIIANQQESPFLIALIEQVYGALYAYMDKHDDSLKHYLRAQNLFQQIGSVYYQGEIAYGLASNFRRAKKWPQAIEWYQNYFGIVETINSDYSLFFFRYGIAMTYSEMNDCDSAMPVIEQALQTHEFKDYRAELYKNLALCQGKKRLFKEAQQSILRAREIFKLMPELAGTSWEIENDKISAQLDAMQGNYEVAYKKLEKYYQQFFIIQNNNNSQSLEKLKLNLQAEREKLHLVKLNNQAQLQQLKLTEQMQKIQTQRFWLYGFVIAIFSVLGIVWFQFKMSKQLKSLAITDELTGLFNRRFIFSTIERMLSEDRQKKVHHTLMLIDVDDLKPINDEYGHQEGDKVLKLIARVGGKILRNGDVFARIGGDEFMLLLTRTDKALENAIAKRILNSVSQSSIDLASGEQLDISVSIGICSISDLSQPAEAIYSQVDEALYRAKSSGRNCFSH